MRAYDETTKCILEWVMYEFDFIARIFNDSNFPSHSSSTFASVREFLLIIIHYPVLI